MDFASFKISYKLGRVKRIMKTWSKDKFGSLPFSRDELLVVINSLDRVEEIRVLQGTELENKNLMNIKSLTLNGQKSSVLSSHFDSPRGGDFGRSMVCSQNPSICLFTSSHP